MPFSNGSTAVTCNSEQILNSLGTRQVITHGPQKCELVWTMIGLEEDTEEQTQVRVKQSNLVGPAGYISMEDGAVGGFVQRAVHGTEEDSATVMMGGYDAVSQPFRTTEASVRGFWKRYRSLMDV